MSVLAAVFDWSCETPNIADLSALLAPWRARAPDGLFFTRAPHALMGVGRRIVRRRERLEVQPLKDVQRGICVVGDLRLDNRDELLNRLQPGSEPSQSDTSLLIAGYERWGEGVAARLVGDFAFVIWDWRRRVVYAARDPFGVRPLVYRKTAGTLMFATAPAQFLSLRDMDRTPNEQTIVDSLEWSFITYGPTFFREIESVRPGHYLTAGQGWQREVEYFHPPSSPTVYSDGEQYREHFRWLFKRAVQDRLDSETPIVAQLSGGLDSSSIVCAANQLLRTSADPVRLLTASALFPGKPYNEQAFIDIVAASVSFPSRRWDGSISSGREFSSPSLSMAGAGVARNGGSVGDLTIAEEEGARVLLSGEAGDYVTGEYGLFNGLLRNGQVLTLLHQIEIAGNQAERERRIRACKKALREELPAAVVTLWDVAHRRIPARPPEWLRPDLHPLWRDRRAWRPSGEGHWLHRLERDTWGFLRAGRLAWVVDILGEHTAAAGIEIRYPFLDSRLVQFILSVPLEHRLLGASRRWFHRESLKPWLPVAIAQRDSKARFDGAVVHWGHQNVERIRDILEAREWASDRFVARKSVTDLLERMSRLPAQAEHWEGWRTLSSIVNLEVWLRAVLRYPHSPENMPMTDGTEIVELSESEDKGAPDRPPYVAPKLTGVGNVRDLLAGGPTTGTDSGQPQTLD